MSPLLLPAIFVGYLVVQEEYNGKHGTTLSDSDVASNGLLRYADYPDLVSGSDRVATTYHRQGQMTTRTDQRGTVRSFNYDKLGRPTDDRVTTTEFYTYDHLNRLSSMERGTPIVTPPPSPSPQPVET